MYYQDDPIPVAMMVNLAAHPNLWPVLVGIIALALAPLEALQNLCRQVLAQEKRQDPSVGFESNHLRAKPLSRIKLSRIKN